MSAPFEAAHAGACARVTGQGVATICREGAGCTGSNRSARPVAGRWMAGVVMLWLLFPGWVQAFAAQIPPPPNHYFNDYARLVKPETAVRLEARLNAFERETSNQIVVAIFPNLPPDTDQFTFTTDVFRAWKPGQAGRDNGAILFVFVRERQIWIQTGYGLEGALPDAICKRITADTIAPAFKAGQFDAGIEAGVNAMIAATHGEYRGTGRTHAQAVARRHQAQGGWGGLILLLILFVIFAQLGRGRRRYSYRRPGGGFWIFPTGGRGDGGGGSSGGDGGGFSGGGGDTGGGGAGSNW